MNKLKVPWHFWLIGIVSLLWNSFGALDYFLSKTMGDPYLQSAGMTEEQIIYFHSMPAWMTAVWAVGVWGAFLGSVLLLVRKSISFYVFTISFLAYILSLVYQYLLSDGGRLQGTSMYIMQVIIFVACIFFIWYSWFAKSRSWLT